MKNEKSLKKEILVILISFSIFIAIIIGLIAMVNFYYSKLTIIEHNQKQVLYQIESEMDKFLSKIYKISYYIESNYQNNNILLKNSEISVSLRCNIDVKNKNNFETAAKDENKGRPNFFDPIKRTLTNTGAGQDPTKKATGEVDYSGPSKKQGGKFTLRLKRLR